MSRLTIAGLSVLAAIHHMPDGRVLRVDKLAGSTRALDRMLRDTPDKHLMRLGGPIVSFGQERGPLNSILESFSPPRVTGGAIGTEAGAIGSYANGEPMYAHELNAAGAAKAAKHTSAATQRIDRIENDVNGLKNDVAAVHGSLTSLGSQIAANHAQIMAEGQRGAQHHNKNPHPPGTQEHYNHNAMMEKKARIFAENAAVDEPVQLTQSRVWEFPIGTGYATGLAGGSQVTLAAQPQTKFQLQRLTADAFQTGTGANTTNGYQGNGLLDLKVGQRSQYNVTGTNGAVIPLSRYQPTMFDGNLDCEVAQTSQYIFIILVSGNLATVTNFINFSAKGRSIAS